MMKRAESSFRLFANHSELSHLHHAKKLVPFNTFTSARPANPSTFNAQFFGGIAFGTNVFLHCHTDADFTMSIIQVLLKGKHQYLLEDEVVVFFPPYNWSRRPPTSWRLPIVQCSHTSLYFF